MDPSEQMLEETSESVGQLPPEGQERPRRAAQRIQPAQPSQSGTSPTQSPQETHVKGPRARKQAIGTSGGARRAQARSQETSGGAQAAHMTPSSANRLENEYQEDADLEPRDPRRTLSTPAYEIEYTSTFDLEHYQILKQQYANLEHHYRQLESKHENALHYIQKEKETMNSLNLVWKSQRRKGQTSSNVLRKRQILYFDCDHRDKNIRRVKSKKITKG